MKRFLLPALFSCVVVSFGWSAEPYHFIKEIPVAGDEGWDYLSVDTAAHRLYVSHGSKVVVIDTKSDGIVGEIADTPGVHGVALASESSLGLITCGRENKAALVDLKALKIITKVDTGENPDGMLFEPRTKEFYTFNGHGKSATVINIKGNVVATIPLEGKPEFPQADPKAGRIYDNLEDKSVVAVIDARKHTVIESWPIAPGEEASGMAIDLAHHRLFLGCGNKLMVMMDSGTGKVLASVPIGDHVDANAFDPGTQLAFSSNGEGTVTIAHEDSPDKLTVVQTLQTERGARTMALDVKTHRIYLPSAKFEPQSEARPGAKRQRPRMIPGSFKILVYGME